MFEKALNALNELSQSWKDQFWDEEDPELVPPDLPMVWTERDGMACIDELELYPLAEIDVSGIEYDVEWLYLPTFDGFDILLFIVCPFEGDPSYLAVRTAVNSNKEE